MDLGYEPVMAMGAGNSLLANAKRKAQEKHCVLALIDLRLMDDDDEQDTSGLILAEEMGDKLRPIILSSYENPKFLTNSASKTYRDLLSSAKWITATSFRRHWMRKRQR